MEEDCLQTLAEDRKWRGWLDIHRQCVPKYGRGDGRRTMKKIHSNKLYSPMPSGRERDLNARCFLANFRCSYLTTQICIFLEINNEPVTWPQKLRQRLSYFNLKQVKHSGMCFRWLTSRSELCWIFHINFSFSDRSCHSMSRCYLTIVCCVRLSTDERTSLLQENIYQELVVHRLHKIRTVFEPAVFYIDYVTALTLWRLTLAL